MADKPRVWLLHIDLTQNEADPGLAKSSYP